ncbi:putative leucine-rich repeat-containing protein DDB_G0290503 [Periplaneta americana]|uniref:putative leucine-rich repeat-containing protein DDB_G0290503 n=1 Tax=Periplaneta americana TaxID=6978 RepID=UPI0037E801B4
MLTAQELVQLRVKVDKTLPTKGTKDFQPSHSWLEKKQIQTALDERKVLLEEERVEKLGTLIKAEWDPELKIAVVTCNVGRQLKHMGRQVGGKIQLYPEEALFLMEANCLELMYSGVTMSIQQAFSMLLSADTGCTFNEYQTYAHLVRQGYNLLRHCKSIQATQYERQIRLHQHTVGQKHRKMKEDISSQEIVVEDSSNGSKNYIDVIDSSLKNGKLQNNVKPEELEIIDVETIEIVDMSDDILPGLVNTNKQGGMEETSNKEKSVNNFVNSQTNLRIEIEETNSVSNANENVTQSDEQEHVNDNLIVSKENTTSLGNECRGTSESCENNLEVTTSKPIDTDHHLTELRYATKDKVDVESDRHISSVDLQNNSHVGSSESVKSDENNELPNMNRELLAKTTDDTNFTRKESESSVTSQERHSPKEINMAETTLLNIKNGKNCNKTSSESCKEENEATDIIIVDDTMGDVGHVEVGSNGNEETLSHETKRLQNEGEILKNSEKDISPDTDVVDISDNSQTSQPEVKLETLSKTKKSSIQNKTSSDINDDIEIVNIVDVKSDTDSEIVEVNQNEICIASTTSSNSQVNYGRRKSYKKNEKISVVKNESTLKNISTMKPNIINIDGQPVNNNKQLIGNRRKVTNIQLKQDELEITPSIIDISEDEVKQGNFKVDDGNSICNNEIEIVDLEDEDSKNQLSWEEERSRILDSIPSIEGKFVIHVKVPNKDLLPQNVCPQKQDYYIQRWRLNAPGIGGKENENWSHNRNRPWEVDHSTADDGQINPWIQNPLGGGGNMFGAAGAWNNNSSSLLRPSANENYQSSFPGILQLQNIFQQAATMLSVLGNPAWAHSGMFGMPAHPAMPHHSRFTYGHRPSWHYQTRPYYRRPYYKKRRRYEPQYNCTSTGLGDQHFTNQCNGRNDMIPLRVENNDSENKERKPIRNDEQEDDNDDDVIVCVSSPIKVDIEQEEWISRESQGCDNSQNGIAARNNEKHRKRRASENPRLFDPPKKLRGFIEKLRLETKEEIKNKSRKVETQGNEAQQDVLLQDNVSPGDVKSWRDLKTVMQVVTLESSSEDEDDVYIVVDDIQGPALRVNEPLVQPGDCRDIDSILKRLQIIKSVSRDEEKQVETNKRLKISFDLYMPTGTFRKASPGLPNYRIIVVGYEDPIAEPREIISLLKTFEDNVPLLFAIVLPDTVTFLQFGSVNLPVETFRP